MNSEIKILMIKKQVKQKAIATAAKVKPCTVSNVLAGRQQSIPIKRITAGMLGISMDRLEKLWSRKAA
jgi:predicted XRE-type DNA-binding protein